MKDMQPLALFWFRRDLRITDNTGLFEALKNNKAVLPVFIFDKDILNKLPDTVDRRVEFIHQHITYLVQELNKSGHSFYIGHGKPVEIFKKIINEFKITAVYTNHDYEPYAQARDAAVSALLKKHSIPFYTFKDQVIFEKSEITKSDGSPYTIFTPYSKVWKQRLSKESVTSSPSEQWINHFYAGKEMPVPTLEAIGFKKSGQSYAPPVVNKSIIRQYHETRNLPAIEGTTHLSVHLRFGTISIRSLVKTALELNEQWLNELIWREFFMMILYHYPYVVEGSFKKKYDQIPWRNDEAEFSRWCTGTTGYPIVDAGMRELNETGFMHNRVRMIVASFLTKHLLIDWRWGEAYFANKLLDYELSSNNGNWQWAAGCGCDAAPYFRIFNPSEQVKRFDPDHKYIKKWVKDLDTLDYPAPIVDHKFARERVLRVFKTALNENEMGG
jgi:deoxyribodipyrimidine photo-lyase